MKIRLLAGYILFFSAVTSFCYASDSVKSNNVTGSNAQTGQFNKVFTEKDSEYFEDLHSKMSNNNPLSEKAKSILNLPLTDLQNNPYKNEANTIFAHKQAQIQKFLGKMSGDSFQGTADINKAHFSTLVFASLSMPDSDIKEMYRSLAGDLESTIVFRGLPKGTTSITQAIIKYQQIARDLNLKVTPNVVINPVWFEQYHVSEVPTIVRLSHPTPNRSGDPATNQPVASPSEVARVVGLITPTWLYERMKEGRKGDLGRQGNVYAIEEIDIIKEMQARAAKIDWEAKKKAALKRAWLNIPIEKLEPATEDKIRLIDPTVTLKKDIKGVKGELVAKAGTKVNPLKKRPFTFIYIAFDGTNKKEVEFVKKMLPEWQKEHNVIKKKVVLMLTDIDRENGWKEHEKFQTDFDNAIFVLQPEIKNTFKLEKHPSLVYAEDDYYVVEEFKID